MGGVPTLGAARQLPGRKDMGGLLEGHIAVVTGGGSGIGAGDCAGLRQGGCAASSCSTPMPRRQPRPARRSRTPGGKAWSFKLDVTDRDTCRKVAERDRQQDRPGLDPGEQCRHQPPQRLHRRPRCRHQGLAGHHGRQSQRRVQRHARVPGPAARHQGPDRQYRLDPVVHACAHAQLSRLHHLQARRAGLHPRARRRARQGRRARQRHRPGLDRDAAQRAGARHQSRRW